MLGKALEMPSLIEPLNHFYLNLLFKDPAHFIDTPVNVLNFDCRFPQHTIEYCIPIRHTKDALSEIQTMIKKEGLYLNFPLEVRFSDCDDIYLSSCFGKEAFCWIGIVMYRPYLKDPPQYKEIFDRFETIMSKFEGRPHWAKAFNKENFDINKLFPCESVETFLALR